VVEVIDVGAIMVDVPAPSSVNAFVMVSCSANVPAPTMMVSPDVAKLTACPIVKNAVANDVPA
jgi:hypothetical protein